MRKLAFAASVIVIAGIAAAIAIPNFLQFRMKSGSREARSNMNRRQARRGRQLAGSIRRSGGRPPAGDGSGCLPDGVRPGAVRRRGEEGAAAEPGVRRPGPLREDHPKPGESGGRGAGLDLLDRRRHRLLRVRPPRPHPRPSAAERRGADRGDDQLLRLRLPGPRRTARSRSGPPSRSSRRRGTPGPSSCISACGLWICGPAGGPRANLVFLLDVSGSMASPDKLPLLKSAFRLLVQNLAARGHRRDRRLRRRRRHGPRTDVGTAARADPRGDRPARSRRLDGRRRGDHAGLCAGGGEFRPRRRSTG